MKKFLTIIIFCLNIILPSVAFANNPTPPDRFTRTILPEVDKEQFKSSADCRFMLTRFENIYFFELDNVVAPTVPAASEETPPPQPTAAELGSIKRFFQAIEMLKASPPDQFLGVNFQNVSQNDVLGCALVTGRIKMFYLSIFIAYALNMMAILAGSISMIFIMIGGYKYVIGALTQSTDDAKKTIINAIIGLLVSTGAWILVNIIQSIISS